jgi:hypothetical protein
VRTNAPCTLYNKYISAGAEVYQRSEISAVKFENRKAINVIKSGLLEADAVVIYIPTVVISGYYVEPKAWQALSVKTGFLTLQPGDYIVRGVATEVISPTFTISDLKAKYNDVVRITTVDRQDAGSPSMWHYQIGAS